MPNACDNTSVGVVISEQRTEGPRYLLFQRVTEPVGIAPCAGHIDDHGDARQAAVDEVAEELGLTVVRLEQVWHGWLGNRCRRAPGPRGAGHDWTVFTADVTGSITPAPREAAAPRWASLEEIDILAARTLARARGELSAAEFAAEPGLEPVWVIWLARMRLLDASYLKLEDVASIRRLYS